MAIITLLEMIHQNLSSFLQMILILMVIFDDSSVSSLKGYIEHQYLRIFLCGFLRSALVGGRTEAVWV
jgi:hypothetical protein